METRETQSRALNMQLCRSRCGEERSLWGTERVRKLAAAQFFFFWRARFSTGGEERANGAPRFFEMESLRRPAMGRYCLIAGRESIKRQRGNTRVRSSREFMYVQGRAGGLFLGLPWGAKVVSWRYEGTVGPVFLIPASSFFFLFFFFFVPFSDAS